jgi:L-glutamine:scyllo-inosose aminotransferase
MSKLALLGGTPVRRSPPAARWPVHDERERANLLRALETGDWGGFPEPAPIAGEFAARFAAHHDAHAGVCVANGSVSLEVALVALGLEAGDEVIVPALTWVATGVAPIHVNAVPVFVDVEPGTWCIDPDALEAAITPRTRAVIPVHLGCQIADLDRLLAIAGRHGLALIEDCAHAHGARWRGRGVGSYGALGSFSFQSSKLMTAGEGGILVGSDDELLQRCHSVVNCGRRAPGYASFPGSVLGINGRITEFQAAILLAQLERLPEATARREAGAAYLEAGFRKIGGLAPLPRDERITTRGIYQLLVRYEPEAFAGVHRDRVLRALGAEGVHFDGPFYVPLPEHPLLQARSAQWPMLRERYGDGIAGSATDPGLRFPVASRAAHEQAVWIHHPYLVGDRPDLDAILEAVAKVKEHAADLR